MWDCRYSLAVKDMTERSLPASLQDAKEQHEARVLGGNSATQAVHVVTFFFQHEDGYEQDVAEFIASSPMYLPSEGQRITLHDVRVTATRIEVTYGATRDGLPAVIAEVAVVPIEETTETPGQPFPAERSHGIAKAF